MTKILRINRENIDRSDIGEAVDALRDGKTVVFPTETVYGLGALASDPGACRKIFEAKNRPADNPLIVHIASMEEFLSLSMNVSESHIAKLRSLWPGPLTVVVRKAVGIPDIVTAGLDTVAIRMPDDNIAKALIDGAGPIAAPSANISTMPSITDSKDAIRFLAGRVDVIIDAGRTNYGIESTILNLTVDPVDLLRPGSYSVEDLEAFFGKINVGDVARGYAESKVAITPGMKYRHYSPRKKLYLADSMESFIKMVENLPDNFVALCTDDTEKFVRGEYINLGPESSPYVIASNLFSAFMKLDDSSKEYGLILPFQEKGIGLAIMNRIRKASYRTVNSLDGIT